MVPGTAHRPFPTVLYETLVDKSEFRLSPLVSKLQYIGLSHHSNYQPVEDLTPKRPAIETEAEFAKIHLQMFCAGAMICAVYKCLCICDYLV